ncbi:MAG: OmpA family protein [Deltaproteobacteria bacterium]|nr:OmpA family protein [Deltaproteobacteria bacterium]
MKKTTSLFFIVASLFLSSVHADDLLDFELEEGKSLILITVQDNNGKRMEGVIVSITRGFRGKPFSRLSDKKGMIKLVVDAGDLYKLKFLSLDVSKKQHVEEFNIPDEEDLRYSLVMTYTPPTSKVFVLEGVLFNTGKATLKKSSYTNLSTLLEYLKMKKSVEIELSGHTDNVGDDESNQKLSEARAQTVRKYLMSKGIPGSRINAVGYGESSPIASNDTAAGRKKNRRTEVRILNE